MEDHLKSHAKRVKYEIGELAAATKPTKLSEVYKLDRIVPVKESVSAFKSPSRTQL